MPNIKDYYINTQQIPKDSLGKRFLWKSSEGCKIPFRFYDKYGVFEVQGIIKKHNKIHLNIMYEDNIYCVAPKVLLSGYIQKIVGEPPTNFNYDVGDIVNNFKILSKEHDSIRYKHMVKWYKCECMNCKTIADRTEYELNKNVGCAVCSNKEVIKGINDIATTDPWMIPYFVDINDAYTHTNQSSKKVYMRCPDCKKKSEHKVIISNLYKHKGFGCSCSDGISFPNKIAFELLKQLKVQNIEREYSPYWIKPRRFDFYFEYNNEKYILEMDGGLGHGNYSYGIKTKDDIGILIDNYKDSLAEQHNIKVIRIDCKISTIEYIKHSIFNSCLNSMFDLNSINWERCEKNARTNLVRNICLEYENDIFISPQELADEYFLDIRSILSYIQIGRRVGWITSDIQDKIRLRCVKKTIKPILVDDKYYFSCVTALEENYSLIFGEDSLSAISLAKKLKNNNGSCEYKGLSVKNISKDALKEKYRNNYKYLYL